MMRLLLSAVVIFGTLAAVAGLSQALFTDTATIENSTFATGSVDLVIAKDDAENSPVLYGPSIGGPNVSGMFPGGGDTFMFWLKNQSDGPASLDLSALINDINGSATLKDDLMVGFSCDVGDDGTADGTIAPKPLSDWGDDALPTSGLGTLTPDDGTNNGTGTDEAKCIMTALLDAGSTASGQNVNFDSEFTGTQTSSLSPSPEPAPSPA